MKLTKEQKALLASYGRSVIAAAVAAYSASGRDPKAVANAVWAAIIPVAIRYFNPKDGAFGKTNKG